MQPAEATQAAPARRRRGAVVVVLLAVTLAGVERGLSVLRARGAAPTGGAEWIWMAGEWSRKAEPVAFYAACDFDLDAVLPAARLQVLADEEYWIHVNSRPVGAGRYPGDGATLDVYEIADLLHEGGNRLVAELRSQRGAGGFLAHLDIGGGRSLCPTGQQWRIFSAWEPGLLRGWAPPDHGRPPISWGRPPTGRWGAPAAGAPRPRHDRLRNAAAVPARERRPLAAPTAANGQTVTRVAWDREVAGLLELRFAEPGALAAIYLGAQPPDPWRQSADRLAITPAREDAWQDVEARRFRFALVASSAPLTDAAVWEREEDANAPQAPPPQANGVLGLGTPDLGSPVKDEVRRQLERLARLAAREES
jgi:hypothetical protein